VCCKTWYEDEVSARRASHQMQLADRRYIPMSSVSLGTEHVLATEAEMRVDVLERYWKPSQLPETWI